MFRFRSRTLSATFDDMFSRNDDVHSNNFKLRFHLHVRLPETDLVKTSVCYTSVTKWNHYIKFIDIYCSSDVYIASDNSFSPVRCQAIIWTNPDTEEVRHGSTFNRKGHVVYSCKEYYGLQQSQRNKRQGNTSRGLTLKQHKATLRAEG